MFNQRVEGLVPLSCFLGVGIHKLGDVLVLKGVDLILVWAHGAIFARLPPRVKSGACEIRPIFQPQFTNPMELRNGPLPCGLIPLKFRRLKVES